MLSRSAHEFEGGRLGHGLGHRRQPGGIVLVLEAGGVGSHRGVVGGRGALDLADALVDRRGVTRELLVQRDLAGIDLVLGLHLDPGDLGARPLLDPGDVLVAAAAERALALLRTGADLRDHGRDVGVDLGQRLLTRRLRRRADRRGQVGHQLRRLLGRRRSRRRDGRGLDHLGLLGVDGGGRIGGGRRVAGVGRARLRGEPEALVDVARGPRDRIRSPAASAAASGASSAVSAAGVGSLDRSELQGSRKPERVSVVAMVQALFLVDGGRPGLARTIGGRVG